MVEYTMQLYNYDVLFITSIKLFLNTTTYFIHYYNFYTAEFYRFLLYYIQKSPRSCYDNLNKRKKAN